MGSGKTTLMNEIYNRMPTFTTLYNDVHENKLFQHRNTLIGKFSFQIYNIINNYDQITNPGPLSAIMSSMTDYWFGENYLYCQTLYNLGYLNETIFKEIEDLFNMYNHIIEKPNLIVYLDLEVEHLMSNIAVRGRNGDYCNTDMEKYLTELIRLFKLSSIGIEEIVIKLKPYQLPGLLKQIPDNRVTQFYTDNYHEPWSLDKLIKLLEGYKS